MSPIIKELVLGEKVTEFKPALLKKEEESIRVTLEGIVTDIDSVT